MHKYTQFIHKEQKYMMHMHTFAHAHTYILQLTWAVNQVTEEGCDLKRHAALLSLHSAESCLVRYL
jgi:hypothetical protein